MANKHRGSSFDDFLKEEGIFEECNTAAVKRVLAFQLEKRAQKTKNDKVTICKENENKPYSSRSSFRSQKIM